MAAVGWVAGVDVGWILVDAWRWWMLVGECLVLADVGWLLEQLSLCCSGLSVLRHKHFHNTGPAVRGGRRPRGSSHVHQGSMTVGHGKMMEHRNVCHRKRYAANHHVQRLLSSKTRVNDFVELLGWLHY